MLNSSKTAGAPVDAELSRFVMWGQLRAAQAITILCGFIVLAQVIFIFSGLPKVEGRPSPAALLLLPLIVVCVGAAEWACSREIKRRLENRSRIPRWMTYASALGEASLPSVGVILMHFLFGWEEALRSPPIGGYFIMLMVSVHRLNPRLTICMGLFEAASLAVILGCGLQSGEVISALQVRFSISFVALILVTTAVAVFTIWLLRRLVHDLMASYRGQARIARQLASTTDAHQRAQEVIWQKDRLFAILGHDLRTPLNGVAGLSEFMARAPERFTAEEIRKYAGDINVTSRHLRELVDNLMEWAQLRTGQTPVQIERWNLGELITCVVVLHQSAAEAKRITCGIDMSPGLEVSTDARMVQTLLRNLLSNAIKFTPHGGEISVVARSEGSGEIVLGVRNSGSQFPEGVTLSRDAAVTSRRGTGGEEGIGIGLLLCRELAERLGGALDFRNETGGVAVEFRFPR